MSARPEALRIAIVGLGPRGLTVLERLLALAPYAPEQHFQIDVFEPNEPGVGVHGCGQPAYLMLNTVAGQLSMFPDQAALGALPERRGPSFYDWCALRDVHVKTGDGQVQGMRRCRDTDFLPRHLLGEYLAWTWRMLSTQLPANVTLSLHAERALRLQRHGAARMALTGEHGTEVVADRLFLTTGHTGRERLRQATTLAPYPLPQAVAAAGAGQSVAVAGFGLAAMDVLAALSVGRGGRHVREGGRCRYLPSGREPAIVLYSRSGMPFHARPDTSSRRERHAPLFATREAVAKLRAGGRRIDFEAELLPLMKDEMRAAWYLQRARLAAGPDVAVAMRAELIAAHAGGQLAEAYARLARRWGAYTPEHHLALAAPDGLEGDDYLRWFRDSVRADLSESALGLERSAMKAALEVWRDLRDVLRDAVAGDGLTPASRQRFFRNYAPLVNRLVAGPQKERHEELLALVEAGVVEIFPGANPVVEEADGGWRLTLAARQGIHQRRVDWLVQGRLDAPGLRDTDAPLLADLARQGWLAQVCAASGLDGVACGAEGLVAGLPEPLARSVWVFGPLAEGATYYNHYVPSSGAWSRAFSDAHRAASACIGLQCGAEVLLARAA